MRRLLIPLLVAAMVFAGCQATPPESRACTTTVSSLTAASSAVTSAAPGDTVCLSNGTYTGNMTLDANGTADGDIMLKPQNRGGVTINGDATLVGDYFTISGFNINGEVILHSGSDHQGVTYNRISGGYFGVVAGESTSAWMTNGFVYANRFVGPFGEDGIRANRYDGLFVGANEFTNIRENGNHSDCLQTVYGGKNLTFKSNYLHDNRCQGFFIKDQAAFCGNYCKVENVHLEDNLFVRNDASCVGVSCGGGPADIDVFGPLEGLTVFHNTTVKDTVGNEVLAVQDPGWLNLSVKDNVLGRLYASGTDAFNAGKGYTTNTNNVVCDTGNWPTSATSGWSTSCSPAFVNPAVDDYRLSSGAAGITWTPTSPPTSAGRYGP